MNVLSALRQRARCKPAKTPLKQVKITATTSRNIQLRFLRPQWQPSIRSPVLRRLASTKPPAPASTSSVTAATGDATARYPASINIYRVGTTSTVTIGLFRAATVLLWLYGGLVYPSAIYFSPDHSNLLIPAVFLGSSIPFFAMAFASGPMIHSISAHLPTAARRGKDELMRVSQRTPRDTLLTLHYMRWRPWPIKRTVQFSRLRRLKPSWRGIANLEHVPANPKTVEKHPFWAGIVSRWMGKFYVNRQQAKDRAAVPAVWDGLWEQIPWEGSKDDPMLGGGGAGSKVRGPVAMRGRGPIAMRAVAPPPRSPAKA